MTTEVCKQVFARLSEYIDGELPPDLCERLDRHIADCAPCVQFVESLRKSRELCRSLEAVAAPGPLAESAREELKTAWRRVLAARESD